jgi:hypothetical protein
MTFDVSCDAGLRAAVEHLQRHPDDKHADIWRGIGAEMLARADRDMHRAGRHTSEFVGAYVASALESLKRHPELVLRARSPWGVLVINARRDAMRAVAMEMAVGLTARDPLTHRPKFSKLPKVISWTGFVWSMTGTSRIADEWNRPCLQPGALVWGRSRRVAADRPIHHRSLRRSQPDHSPLEQLLGTDA